MDLDFTWLGNLALKPEPRECTHLEPQNPLQGPEMGSQTGQGEYTDTTQAENAAEGLLEPLRGMSVLKERERAREEAHRQSMEVYREYQANIRASELKQAEILKGIRAGADPYDLLLTAVEAIAGMTHNELFLRQAREDLIAIQGEALLEPAPLAWEIETVEHRLEHLRGALAQEEDEEGRRRLAGAVRAHEERIAGLRGKLDSIHTSAH